MTNNAACCRTASTGDPTISTAPGFLTRWGWLIVALLGLAMYFVGIWSYHFLDPDEGRYAEIPREMLESGDFVTPRLNYVKYFEKPPLLYWITAGAFALAGEKEWAGRAVPATAGFLTLLLVMGLGRRMWGKRGGVISGWVYLTSLLPLVMARLLIIDGLFGLCLSACWAAWWLGTDTEEARAKRRWYLAAWACLALATLAKGPTAIAMSLGVVVVYCALRRNFRPLREMAWAPGLLLFAVIAFPWHVLVSLANPEFPYYYIVVQHLLRATGQEHIKPAWYFFVITPLGMWGWALIILPVFWAGLRKSLTLWHRPAATATADAVSPASDREQSAVTFLVVWALGVVVFFSLSRCKLVPYMQPAYPALALLIGWYLTRGVRVITAVRVAAAVTGLLFLCVGIAAPFLAADQDVVPAARFMPLAHGLAAAMIVGALALFLSSFSGRRLGVTPGLVLALIVPFLVANIPLFAQYKRVGAILDGMPQPMPADVRIAEWNSYDQSLSFYLHRRVTLIGTRDELGFGSEIGDNREYFLDGPEDLPALSSKGPLLLLVIPRDWDIAKTWGEFQVVAANSSNIMLGNRAFFERTRLRPWSHEAVTKSPLLLMPQPQSSATTPLPSG